MKKTKALTFSTIKSVNLIFGTRMGDRRRHPFADLMKQTREPRRTALAHRQAVVAYEVSHTTVHKVQAHFPLGVPPRLVPDVGMVNRAISKSRSGFHVDHYTLPDCRCYMTHSRHVRLWPPQGSDLSRTRWTRGEKGEWDIQ